MHVTSLYWRQLYLYLLRQQRRQRRAQRQIALRAALPAYWQRPYGPTPRRPLTM